MACSGRRLPDLWTQITPLNCLPARAAMTVPNGVLLVGRPDAVLSGVELPGDAWSYRADGLRACSRPHLTWKRHCLGCEWKLSLIHISEPTRRTPISYAVFCLKKKKK